MSRCRFSGVATDRVAQRDSARDERYGAMLVTWAKQLSVATPSAGSSRSGSSFSGVELVTLLQRVAGRSIDGDYEVAEGAGAFDAIHGRGACPHVPVGYGNT